MDDLAEVFTRKTLDEMRLKDTEKLQALASEPPRISEKRKGLEEKKKDLERALQAYRSNFGAYHTNHVRLSNRSHRSAAHIYPPEHKPYFQDHHRIYRTGSHSAATTPHSNSSLTSPQSISLGSDNTILTSPSRENTPTRQHRVKDGSAQTPKERNGAESDIPSLSHDATLTARMIDPNRPPLSKDQVSDYIERRLKTDSPNILSEAGHSSPAIALKQVIPDSEEF
jgi:hypothetical protein